MLSQNLKFWESLNISNKMVAQKFKKDYTIFMFFTKAGIKTAFPALEFYEVKLQGNAAKWNCPALGSYYANKRLPNSTPPCQINLSIFVF
jgi:hypothetical protein